MVDWPATLPQNFLVSGFSHQAAKNTVAFQPEQGPTMVRRRGTSAPQRFSGALPPITVEQWEDFDTFYRLTVRDGAVRFDWRHPITLEPAVVQFDPEAGPPQTTAAGANIYAVSFTLLILP